MAYHLDPEFIGLHVAEIHLALLDKMPVDVLAVLACTCLPLSDGTLIKPKRRHNGLERTPVAKQGNTKVTTSVAVRSL